MSKVNNSLYKWLLIHCDSFWWLNYSGDSEKILKEMRIPDHLNCFLGNVYIGQDATPRTRHATMYWFKLKTGVCQSWMLALCLLNLHADSIMQNAGLDEAQAGIKIQFSSVQLFSHVPLFVNPWASACQASLSITNSHTLPKLKLMSIKSVMPSSHLILCRPLLLLRSIFPSIRVFSNESALHMRLPKYWSFSLNISPSNEHPGLISFRMDWLDLLAVQGTLKSLLQHHGSKASILQRSAFFIVQLSHLSMTTGKTTALTRWTFVGKVTSLLSNMLSKLVITFLPRSKCLLISWLQSPSVVISEPPKIVSHCFHCFPIYLSCMKW